MNGNILVSLRGRAVALGHALAIGLGANLVCATPSSARELRLGNAFGTMDASVEVPVVLGAAGDENSISFSVKFDPASFSFEQFSPAPQAQGSSILLNSSTEGRVGILIGKNVGESFPAGDYEIGRVLLKAKVVSLGRPITFADQPVTRQIVNAEAVPLATSYEAGMATAVERSVRLVPTQAVNGAEFTQEIQSVGSGLENAWSFTLEFDPAKIEFRSIQASAALEGAALVANRLEIAQGRIGVLLALPGGRALAAGTNHLAALHFRAIGSSTDTTVRFVNGPIAPQTVDMNAIALPSRFENGPVGLGQRRLRIGLAEVELGDSFDLPIELVASGDEQALSFSFKFDPKQLEFLSAVPGPFVNPAGLQLNTNAIANGQVGLILGASPGAVLPAGLIETARLHFFARGTPGFATVGFANSPLQIQILGRAGEELALSQSDGGFTLRSPSAPKILDQPRDVEMRTGEAAQFSVAADGSRPLLFQWRRDGLELMGQTNSQLALPTSPTEDAALISVEVRNSAGVAVSRSARLDLLVPPFITRQPESLIVLAGTSFELGVVAEGTAPLNYRWQRNGVLLPEATLPKLAIPSAGTVQEGNYQVVVGNRSGVNAISQVARIPIPALSFS
ncbi:MAG: hypothetical protein L0Z50_00605 [Verrucomicrobiales bacterium]|nr:hypothetical protein [Verrucomicrobiales bacterium]